MKTLTHTFQILFFLILSNTILCQDYTWIGGNGLWNDPQMWSPNGVPQMNDDVFIAKGTVHIDNGYLAEVKFIEIHSTGELKVLSNARLEVVGNINDPGILNYGIVEVFGKVKSKGHSGGLSIEIGFRNFGEFHIYSEGIYLRNGCSE